MKIGLNSKMNIEQWGPVEMKMLYISFWFAPVCGEIKSPYSVYFHKLLAIIKADTATFYWQKEGLENNAFKSINKYLLNKAKLRELSLEYFKLVKNLESLNLEIENCYKNLDNWVNIVYLAKQWYKLYTEFWLLTDVFEVANYGAPRFLEKKLKRCVPKDKTQEVLEVLLAPEELSFNQKSQLELFELASKDLSEEELKNELILYAEHWHWLNNSYYNYKKLSYKYFLHELKKIDLNEVKEQVLEIKNYSKLIKNKKKQYCKKYKIPNHILQLAQNLSYSIWLQDHRKGVAWWAIHPISLLSYSLSKKIKINLKDILNYDAKEWLAAFISGQNKASFKQRRTWCLYYSDFGKYSFFVSKKYKLFAKRFIDALNLNKIDENFVKGLVVSRSEKNVLGKARLLKSPNDIKFMKKGEILVTGMTSPDYIQAMRISKAIVTDVGGLMSHVAVVSRELKIPCIIGTKIGTKVFKDGDLVEVDANKGVVRKIK